MTSYSPTAHYTAQGDILNSDVVLRLTQYHTSDEIHFTHAGNLNRRFKFTISTNTWSDASSNTLPHALSNGLTTITPSSFGGDVNGTPQPEIIGLCGSSGGSIYGAFGNPFYSSSGSGTGTEGSSYSGTLTVNGTSLEYEIPATSSSGTYELKADGITQLPIVHGSTASTGSAPNFDQTKIWTLISPMGDELDEIDLTGSGGSLTKKVFCNFW